MIRMWSDRRSKSVVFLILCFAVSYVVEFAAADDGLSRRLTLNLVAAASNQPVSGIVRIKRFDTGEYVQPPELIPRHNNWLTTQASVQISVPATELQIEAVRGLQTLLAVAKVDATADTPHDVSLQLHSFYDARSRGWRNGNTHLHIMNRSRIAAERYLREVPEADGLELVFLSHLRRIPDEKDYISNQIVEQHLRSDVLTKISDGRCLLRPGEEHRHNFGRGGEGFGHVMLLDIAKLIRPVSIGPGIMRTGTDGTPLRPGILEARRDGATVVWCHNSYGFEDIPSWTGGLLDAQNIYDGGSQGRYEESFYKYLNLGWKIPFSTGTDWFIEDFSRVYVPIDGVMTSEAWLQQLAAGRSFITNGPLLEFTVNDQAIGETLRLDRSQDVRIKARAVGRLDFGHLQLIRNGEIVEAVTARPRDGHFEAQLDMTLTIAEPCWLAVRTPDDGPDNEFGRPIFSHSSPIYAEFQGRRVFRAEVALDLIQQMEESLLQIRAKAVFAGDEESQRVMQVYREGIRTLKKRLQEDSTDR